MDDKNLNREIKPLIKKRFYGHKRLYSKYLPRFPASAERDYFRLCRDYFGLMKECLEEELPTFKEVYRKTINESKNVHHDSADDLWNAITLMFNNISNKLQKKIETFDLGRRLENIARATRKLTVREWRNAIHKTLGIDIREDYYLGDFYQEYLKQWSDQNVDLIKTIPYETLDNMRQLIYDGYVKGTCTTDIAKQINRAYGTGMKHAMFIARDQMSKLNSNLAQAQQRDAGVSHYRWQTCGDERVRESHRALDRKVFSWDDPPETDGGRRCHPGEDYGCRCYPEPVFDLDEITLPVDWDSMSDKIGRNYMKNRGGMNGRT